MERAVAASAQGDEAIRTLLEDHLRLVRRVYSAMERTHGREPDRSRANDAGDGVEDAAHEDDGERREDREREDEHEAGNHEARGVHSGMDARRAHSTGMEDDDGAFGSSWASARRAPSLSATVRAASPRSAQPTPQPRARAVARSGLLGRTEDPEVGDTELRERLLESRRTEEEALARWERERQAASDARARLTALLR